jgi:hypothetical protein
MRLIPLVEYIIVDYLYIMLIREKIYAGIHCFCLLPKVIPLIFCSVNFNFSFKSINVGGWVTSSIEKSRFDQFLQEEFHVAQFGFSDAQCGQNAQISVLHGHEHGSQMFQVGAHQTQCRAKIAQCLRLYLQKLAKINSTFVIRPNKKTIDMKIDT